MSGMKNERGAESDEVRDAERPQHQAGPHENIEDIARRLDQLLLTMSEPSDLHVSPRTVEAGMADAARREYRERQERERVFGPGIAADPAWDILLHLFIAREEGRDVTVFSITAATPVAEGTILRCIAHLVEAKLIARGPHLSDPRSILLRLSNHAAAMMCDYFSRTAAALDAAGA
jgi:hypothetical protein